MDQKEFLAQTVNEYKDHLEKNFRADIIKENLVNTKHLLDSIYATSTTGKDRANMSFTLPFYGIYHDMRKRNKANAEADLFPRRKNSVKKGSYPWYNKNLWGTLGFFIRDLLFGYVDETKHAVKKHFPTPNI